jgi:hypothetical protein
MHLATMWFSILGASSWDRMGWINVEYFRLQNPDFAVVLIRHKAIERLPPWSEVVCSKEVIQVPAQLLVTVIMEPLHGRVFDCCFHCSTRCPAGDCLQSTRGDIELPVQGIVGHDSGAATIRSGLLFGANPGPYARQTGQAPKPIWADVCAKIAQVVVEFAISIDRAAVIPNSLEKLGLTLIFQCSVGKSVSRSQAQKPLG